MSLVLDASVTAARMHIDEITPEIIDIFDRIMRQEAWVPSLWHLEIANVFQYKVRKGKYNPQTRDRYFGFLRRLPIFTDDETTDHAWTKTLQIAGKHDLTMYDAAYLELALRRQLPLATLDMDLRAAAGREGVQLLGI